MNKQDYVEAFKLFIRTASEEEKQGVFEWMTVQINAQQDEAQLINDE